MDKITPYRGIKYIGISIFNFISYFNSFFSKRSALGIKEGSTSVISLGYYNLICSTIRNLLIS